MDLKILFDEAVVNSKMLTEKPSNDVLLQLYALYKQSTEGDITSDQPSNPFDFVAKVKFDAWGQLQGKSKEAAMQEYIDQVAKLKQ
ncbi:MAG: acyl-CoA-binding protein [Ferruginibacter sp.]